VDFGEKDQAKGFMVFDIDPAKPLGQRLGGAGAPRFETVDARRFVEVEVSPKDLDPTPEVCRAVEKSEPADAIVRVVVHLSREQLTYFRQPEVRRYLEDAHVVAGIRTLTPRDDRGTLPGGVTVDAASPLEALDIYLRAKQYDDGRRERLRRAAEDLVLSTDIVLPAAAGGSDG
jgi:exonuclease SbcD